MSVEEVDDDLDDLIDQALCQGKNAPSLASKKDGKLDNFNENRWSRDENFSENVVNVREILENLKLEFSREKSALAKSEKSDTVLKKILICDAALEVFNDNSKTADKKLTEVNCNSEEPSYNLHY